MIKFENSGAGVVAVGDGVAVGVVVGSGVAVGVLLGAGEGEGVYVAVAVATAIGSGVAVLAGGWAVLQADRMIKIQKIKMVYAVCF